MIEVFNLHCLVVLFFIIIPLFIVLINISHFQTWVECLDVILSAETVVIVCRILIWPQPVIGLLNIMWGFASLRNYDGLTEENVNSIQ